MVTRTELITLHIFDLLELLGTSIAEGGSMTLRTKDEEEMEVDLDDLCMVVRIESSLDCARAHQSILPFEPV